MIALDLCQAHYQVLLMVFLKYLTTINAQIVNLVLNVISLKIISEYLVVQKAIKAIKKHLNKDLQTDINSVMETLIKFL